MGKLLDIKSLASGEIVVQIGLENVTF